MAKKQDEKPMLSLINIAAIVALIVVVGIGGHFLGRYQENQQTSDAQEISGVQTISYEGEEGKTALELLQQKAEVKITESTLGSFVTEINGVSNSTDHYWLFYVNGEMAATGADQYVTKAGDQIEWRYETL